MLPAEKPLRPWARWHVGPLGCILGLVALVATALVVLIVVVSIRDPLGLVLSIGAASIPALAYAALVLRLDRYEPEPKRTIAACLAWGAIGAILGSLIGELIVGHWLVETLGRAAGSFTSVVLGAPLVEESFKGIAVLIILRVARNEFDDVLDGLVYGALIGVGFAMTENILYFGQGYLEEGFRGFGVLVLSRAVLSGLGHPAYTAITGAAVGWARSRHGQGVMRFIVPFLGWLTAVALHALWNGGLVIATALLGPGAGLVEVVALLSALVIVPAVLVLYAVARASTRQELEVLRDELWGEVGRGTLTEPEYLTIMQTPRRERALAAARERGGRGLRWQQQAFFQSAADLAFALDHQRRGEATGRAAIEQDAARQALARLRNALATSGLATEAAPSTPVDSAAIGLHTKETGPSGHMGANDPA
jgi:RsiW-degrading membrane proteinase PrsW (M82 family)